MLAARQPISHSMEQKLSAVKKNTVILYFYYDESGSPIGMKLNGTNHYFVKNIQGDVIALVDETGTVTATYKYDAWGNLITYTGGGAALANPFRYRSYYWDIETGYYYLNSRYYDPVTGRFLNADGYLSTGQGVISYNMFAYCLNNPVGMIDSTGCMPTAYEMSEMISGIKPNPNNYNIKDCVRKLKEELRGTPCNPICGAKEKKDFPFYINSKKPHSGTDLEAKIGTPVRAAASGTVNKISKSVNNNCRGAQGLKSYGMYIEVKTSSNTIMRYAHLSEIYVEEGMNVYSWDVIGKSGNTGNSSGPHLHFEVRKDNVPVNPYDYLP